MNDNTRIISGKALPLMWGMVVIIEDQWELMLVDKGGS